jgi:hypothetical protein
MNYRQSEEFSQKVKDGMLCAKAQGKSIGGFVDLTGRTFGKLVVRSQANNGKCGRVRWNCDCECGNHTVVSAENLAAGRTESCRCGMGVRRNQRVPPYKYVWFNYRGSAKRRDLSFTLTLEQLAFIISQPCDYCGEPPSRPMSPSQMRHSSYESFRYNGIDRIDSDKGYVEGNVVPCCQPCNEMKSDKSRDEFLRLIAAIYRHRIAKSAKTVI